VDPLSATAPNEPRPKPPDFFSSKRLAIRTSRGQNPGVDKQRLS